VKNGTRANIKSCRSNMEQYHQHPEFNH
jgi:hypothetical protein